MKLLRNVLIVLLVLLSLTACSSVMKVIDPAYYYQNMYAKEAEERNKTLENASSVSELKSFNTSNLKNSDEWKKYYAAVERVVPQEVKKVQSMGQLVNLWEWTRSGVNSKMNSSSLHPLFNTRANEIIALTNITDVYAWLSVLSVARVDTGFYFDFGPFFNSVSRYCQELLNKISSKKDADSAQENLKIWYQVQVLLEGLTGKSGEDYDAQYVYMGESATKNAVNVYYAFYKSLRDYTISLLDNYRFKYPDLASVKTDLTNRYLWEETVYSWDYDSYSIKKIRAFYKWYGELLEDCFQYMHYVDLHGSFKSCKDLTSKTNGTIHTDSVVKITTAYIENEKEYISKTLYPNEWNACQTIVTGVQDLDKIDKYYDLCESYLSMYKESTDAFNDIHYNAITKIRDNLKKILNWINSEAFELVFFNIPDSIQNMPLYYGHKKVLYKSADTS